MNPQDWSRIQQGIFAGESGGDYGALFGYQNRPNGRFSGVDLTKMTVDQALDFANPSGPYGQYVKGQVGRVATPMGAYQIVGTTLRAAKEGLGLRGDEVLTPAMQDKLGQWIYKTQGTGAWEGYKPMTDAQAIAAETMTTLGQKPQGVLAPAQTSMKGPQMMQEQKPQGLLGSLGIQKRDEAAGGETALPFYQRDTFKDTAAILAQGFGRMGIMGMEEIADDIAKQRTENKARNKTAEYLRKSGRGDLADMVEQGMIGGREAAGVLLQKPEDDRTAMMKNYEFYISKGMSPEQAMAALKSGTTIQMPGAPTIGTIPQGYQAIQDPQTGVYRLEVLEGGPAAAEAEESVAKEALRGAQESRSAGVVLENVQAVKDKLESSLLPITGLGGSLLKQLPGTNAFDVSGLVKTIRGNIGFDRLQQMRDASPTGGALGQVAVQELEMLQSVLGNLDQAQSEEQFLANLNRVESIYSDIMRKAAAYPNAAEFGFGGAAPAASDDPLGLRN
jgi:hypothetical protein